jgi:cell division protein FtsB
VRIPEKYWLGLTLAVGIAILAVAIFGDQGLREIHRLRSENRALAVEIANLRSQREGLEKEIRNLRENPRAIESRAREDLGMIRKGETVFLLPEHHETRR